MIIVSQNKERVLWFGRAFNALEYNEDISKKGKQEIIRHTICISDGCLEEIAEYDSKERCLAVLKDFCGQMNFSTSQHRHKDRRHTERISCISSQRSRRRLWQEK